MVNSLHWEERRMAEECDKKNREVPKHLNDEGESGGCFTDGVERTNRENSGLGRSGLPSARRSLKTLAKIVRFCNIVCLLHPLKDSWVTVFAD